MTAHAHPMSRVDTAWLRMDTDVNLMMIIGVWLLRPAIRLDDLRERVRTRLLHYPRFREKVVQGTLASEWVEDEDFDIRRHVVAERLKPRRGQSMRDALKQRMGELASTPLDHAHPLWCFNLVEDYDGGSASICRIHHCIGDGVALNSVMMSIADDAIEPPELARQAAHDAAAAEHHQGDWLAEELIRPLTQVAVKAIGASGEALVRSLHVLEHPLESLLGLRELAGSGVRLVSDAAELALLPNDSPTSLKGHGSGRKQVAWCEPLALEPVKAVGKALGASVNDVLIACVAGSIGRYLRETGGDPAGKDIRAMVPVNMRPLDEAWQLGNRFGLVPLLVPVGIDNPLERLRVVHERMEALKTGFQPLLSYGLLGLSGLLNEGGQKALSNLFLDKTTAVMTNVPGPTKPIRFCGSTVTQSIFWVPSSGDVGVGVSIISYAGAVQFGLITDESLCPHPARIIDRFAHEFEQMLWLALMLPWKGHDAEDLSAARWQAADRELQHE
jgi:diacylglycerol O-acyltransferase / wax synthase